MDLAIFKPQKIVCELKTNIKLLDERLSSTFPEAKRHFQMSVTKYSEMKNTKMQQQQQRCNIHQ